MKRYLYVLSIVVFSIGCQSSEKYECEMEYTIARVSVDCALAANSYERIQNGSTQNKAAGEVIILNCLNTFQKYKECQSKSEFDF